MELYCDDVSLYCLNQARLIKKCNASQLKVNIIAIDCVHKEKPKMNVNGRYILDAELKGRNIPSDAVVRSCTLVDTEAMVRLNDEIVDGTIVIGR